MVDSNKRELALRSSYPVLADWKLRVVFPQTKSVHYRNAVRLAKLMDSYREKVEPDGTLLHIVEFKPHELRRFKVLRGITENWKGCLFFIGGELVNIDELQFLECYRGKLMTKNYSYYCLSHLDWSDRSDSPFICKLMFYRRHYDRWYNFGAMDKGIFYIDKPKIAEVILESNKYNKYCPAIDIAEAARRLDGLPETINPLKDKGWKYWSFSVFRDTADGVGKDYQYWRGSAE